MVKVELHESLFKLHLRILCFKEGYPMEIKNEDFKRLLRENVKPVVLNFDVHDLMAEHARPIPRQVYWPNLRSKASLFRVNLIKMMKSKSNNHSNQKFNQDKGPKLKISLILAALGSFSTKIKLNNLLLKIVKAFALREQLVLENQNLLNENLK